MIKLKKIFLLLILLILMLVGCEKKGPDSSQPGDTYPTPDWNAIPAVLPDSMKGYELYSWQSGSEWIFTLINGTNRNKSFEEITAPGNQVDPSGLIKVTVIGVDNLKTLLKRLPTGATVTWSGIKLSGEVAEGTQYFTYPPDEMMTNITKFASDLGLQLNTLQNAN